MPLEPEDPLALPVIVIVLVVAVMVVVAASGGNAVWLGDLARAIVYPLTVISALAAIGLAAYQSVLSSFRQVQ